MSSVTAEWIVSARTRNRFRVWACSRSRQSPPRRAKICRSSTRMDRLKPSTTSRRVSATWNPSGRILDDHDLGNQCRPVAQWIKTLHPDGLTVVGVPHVSAIPERTLAAFPALDYGSFGEGETPFFQLLEALGARADPSASAGFVAGRWAGPSSPRPDRTSRSLRAPRSYRRG